MLFNSIEFLLFIPIVFLLYWFVFKKRNLQNFFVVIASYVFYGWWNWRFLVLIFFTSVCSFLSGLLLERYEGRCLVQKTISTTNIIINLAVLFFFKYFNFFVDNLNSFYVAFSGHELGWVSMNIILPVGISFYTFQALSYSIDVYKHNIRATHDPIEFFAYISFFPQLVAGPIERATNLLPQFQQERVFVYSEAVDGLKQMLWGFFKKMVIADGCATIVNAHWNEYGELSGLTLLSLGVLFTFQIYCDFSGYSDIAIGCAKLFGFKLMRNFNLPYFSRSIPEFWRRWHISLTSWFTDYVYKPLGGSRCAKWKIIRNVCIVWAISGLWHGANWTFVCWGLYHATILVLYIILGINTKQKEIVAYGRYLPNFIETAQLIFTFLLAVIGWIIFRAENLTQAIEIINRIFTRPLQGQVTFYGKEEMLLCAMLLLTEWLQRNKQHVLEFSSKIFIEYRVMRWILYYAIILSVFILSTQGQTFIYFQF